MSCEIVALFERGKDSEKEIVLEKKEEYVMLRDRRESRLCYKREFSLSAQRACSHIYIFSIVYNGLRETDIPSHSNPNMVRSFST